MIPKPATLWSYSPYKPLFFETGDPYVCRLAPGADCIRVEWLASGPGPYRVFVRRRGGGAFAEAGVTDDTGFDIVGLVPETDYELYVASPTGRSRTRLARTGALLSGTVVNYLHPDDEAYAFSGRYLCSPSLLRLPDGALLASMDLYAGGTPQNLTLIFRSDDDGATWHHHPPQRGADRAGDSFRHSGRSCFCTARPSMPSRAQLNTAIFSSAGPMTAAAPSAPRLFFSADQGAGEVGLASIRTRSPWSPSPAASGTRSNGAVGRRTTMPRWSCRHRRTPTSWTPLHGAFPSPSPTTTSHGVCPPVLP